MNTEDPRPDLNITVQLKPRDAYLATLSVLFNTTTVVIWTLILGVYAYLSLSKYNSPAFGVGVLFALAFFLLTPAVMVLSSLKSAMLKFPIRHTFSEAGLLSNCHGGSVGVDWNLIKSARETERYISIQGRRGAPMLLPKDQLAPADLASFRDILRRHVKMVRLRDYQCPNA